MDNGRSSRGARNEQEYDVTNEPRELLGDGDVHGTDVPTEAISSGTDDVTERKSDVMQSPTAAVSEVVNKVRGVDPDERKPARRNSASKA
jgi:hypothetical protein